MCFLVMVCGPCKECTDWLPWVGGSFMLLLLLSPSHSSNMVGYTTSRAQQGHLIALPSLHCRQGSSVPGSSPPDDMVNSQSVMVGKPGDIDVVIWYQAEEFTHTWLAEHFITQPHIYPGFTEKVSTLCHLPLKLAVRIIPVGARLLRTSSMV